MSKHQWGSDEELRADFLRDCKAVPPQWLSELFLTTGESWTVIWYLQLALVATPASTNGHAEAVSIVERLIALNARTPAQLEFARRGWLKLDPPELPDSETAAPIGAAPGEPKATESTAADEGSPL